MPDEHSQAKEAYERAKAIRGKVADIIEALEEGRLARLEGTIYTALSRIALLTIELATERADELERPHYDRIYGSDDHPADPGGAPRGGSRSRRK